MFLSSHNPAISDQKAKNTPNTMRRTVIPRVPFERTGKGLPSPRLMNFCCNLLFVYQCAAITGMFDDYILPVFGNAQEMLRAGGSSGQGASQLCFTSITWYADHT